MKTTAIKEKWEGEMICQRCLGLCVAESLIESGRRIVASRCINCGCVVDSTISENKKRFTDRRAQAKAKTAKNYACPPRNLGGILN